MRIASGSGACAERSGAKKSVTGLCRLLQSILPSYQTQKPNIVLVNGGLFGRSGASRDHGGNVGFKSAAFLFDPSSWV